MDAKLGARGHPIKRIVAHIHGDDIAVLNGELQKCIRTGAPFSVEYRVRSSDTLRWARADGRCTLDDNGRPMRMLGSIVDITREKPPQNVIVMRKQVQRK